MFELDEEHGEYLQAARDFATAEIAPYASAWDEASYFPIDTLRKAASLGYATMYCDEAHGGSGLSRLAAALIFEGLAESCVSTAAYLSVHNMVAWMINQFGTSQQKQQYLPTLSSMAEFGSYCLTEPQSGSDAASLKTSARREGDYYYLNGTKAFISGAGVSGIYVVMARTGEKGPKGISAFIVEKNFKGISFGKPEKKMGWKNQPTAQVMFEECAVPASNMLGEEGKGFSMAMQALDGGRVNIASCSLGAAASCVEAARRYLNEREQFSQKLANFQALQFKLADMATSLEASRLMVYRAAAAIDNKLADKSMKAAMAKKFATDACFDICNQALQLHGGYGYIHDYGIEQKLRDVRVHQILEGTNEIMRLIIARQLLL
ncbi:MAG: acyl-CoA dehydrogenase family protein [Alphaproteobacteria bacterium]